MDGKDALALLGNKKKGKKQKNKGRKIGRNLRWGIGPDGKAISHSQTKYRSEGHRERNKRRHAAQRAARKLALAEKRVPVT